MKGFIDNIEKLTLENDNYRKVLYTAEHIQLVLMSLKPGDEIGLETHDLAQFIRVEQGNGQVIIDGQTHSIEDDFAIIIPAGAEHNIINTGDMDLKLYSLYAPPEHKDGVLHPTKSDDKEEHFDGQTTE